MTENGAKDCYSQHDIMPVVRPVTAYSDSSISIPAIEMRIINSDPHRQQEKELVSTLIPRGGTMWFHPDLLDDIRQWTTVSCKKSRGKIKQANVIIASTIEPDSDVNYLSDSEKEEKVLA